MESIVVLVGFLGAGKTSLLQKVLTDAIQKGKQPFVIINDYQNAQFDVQRFSELMEPSLVKALSGSCICCSGMTELRSLINSIPARKNGITFIEANGTSDACTLMEFLGVGIADRFNPPIQISVVDTRHWQKRGFHNSLESSQAQVASLVVLNHIETLAETRVSEVKTSITNLNPTVTFQTWDCLDFDLWPHLNASTNQAEKFDHSKAHWASCSVDLPDPMSSISLKTLIESIPEGILRIKGCTKIDDDPYYSIIERLPTGEVLLKPFHGRLITGPKLIVVGPGSDPWQLKELVKKSQRTSEKART